MFERIADLFALLYLTPLVVQKDIQLVPMFVFLSSRNDELLNHSPDYTSHNLSYKGIFSMQHP